MIKIDLDAKKVCVSKCHLEGRIQVSGDIDIVAQEIYQIIKDFEENATEAWLLAMSRHVDEMMRKGLNKR